jgi:hypothetical protein
MNHSALQQSGSDDMHWRWFCFVCGTGLVLCFVRKRRIAAVDLRHRRLSQVDAGVWQRYIWLAAGGFACLAVRSYSSTLADCFHNSSMATAALACFEDAEQQQLLQQAR